MELKNEKKITVTVGIPAYNEEANTKNLLKALLEQKQDGFELLEIIVVSDGSDDNTVEQAKSLTSEKISVIDGKDRRGQAQRQNEIMDIFKGDFLVLLNADILPKDKTFLSNIVKPFSLNPKIGLVGGKVSPLPAENLFEKVLNFSVAMKQEIVESMNGGDNIYMCHGAGRAFSKAFVNQFRWGSAVSEDAYSYLVCKKMGFDFAYARDVEILYRSPQNFKDHMRQSVRFLKGKKNLADNISSSEVLREHKIPLRIILKSSVKYFFKNPFLFTAYISILISAKILSLSGKDVNVKWDSATSSKTLIKS